MNDQPLPPPDDDSIHAALAEGLRALQRDVIFVPAAVDAAVLEEARRHLAAGRRRRMHRRVAGWMAAAASLVLAGWLAQLALSSNRPLAREDIDGNGRVDILDAFALARKIERGGGRFVDLNGDGTMDRLDVEIIAARAVRLGGGA